MTRRAVSLPIPVLFGGIALVAGGLLAGCSGRRAANPPIRVQPVSSPGAPVGPGQDGTSGITAHGVGQVSGTPDVLTVTVGVETNASSAASAFSDNSDRAHAIVDQLKKHGVQDKDIQTSQLSLWPDYGPNNSLNGYHATNTVTAKLRKLDDAGSTIDAVVKAGGDAARVQGVFFSFDDSGGLKAAARQDAITKAHDQAKQMADAAGVKLGAVRSITEAAPPPSYGPYGYGVAADATAAGANRAAPTPVQPGTAELTVDVTVIYDIAS